jgi:ADP-heptose:LPS heptosyltransferase
VKIVVVRPGAMGDILFTTPALRALKKKHPGSHVTYVLMRKWRFLLRGNPYVDRVVGLRYRDPAALGRWARETYDLLINLHEVEDAARICQAIPARERRGHQWIDGRLQPDGNSHDFLAREEAWRRLHESGTHYPELFCRIAGVQADSYRYDFEPGAVAAWRARRFLKRRGLGRPPLPVALHLYSRGSPSKRWSPESATEVTRILEGQRFLVLGYKRDREHTRPLENLPNVTVTCAGMRAQAEMLRRCALFVGIDSGPRHVASAMGTPVLCLFGPRPKSLLPKFPNEEALEVNELCAPCFEETCPLGRDCMGQIRPERIAEAIRRMLIRSRSRTDGEQTSPANPKAPRR